MRASGWKHITGWASIEGHLLRRRHFTPAVLEQIAERIAASERAHAGELMLAIEAVSPAHEPDSHARALEVFGKLRVWDTPLNTGVLLYLALDRHSIELIADRGVTAPADAWQGVCDRLRQNLQRGSYVEGVLMAVEDIEAICARHCPPSGADSVNTTDAAPGRRPGGHYPAQPALRLPHRPPDHARGQPGGFGITTPSSPRKAGTSVWSRQG